MKHISIYAVLLFLSISACKKEEKKEIQKPIPEVLIEFGYDQALFGVTNWVNQNAITIDSVTKYDLFGVSITETNLSSYHGFTMDSGIVEFELKTNNDREFFNPYDNIDSKGKHTSDGFGIYEFGASAFLPYKISQTAIKGNDTIEISNLGDAVRIYYNSRYTGLNASDSITINP